MAWENLLSVVFYLHFTCGIPVPSIEKVMGLEFIRHGFRKGKRRLLRELMYECRYREASDPRDKIYGLYGLMGDSIDEFIKPDYTKSVEEVYTHATFHFISQSQSLDPICGQQFIGRRPGLPTWVPDYELNLGQAADPLIPQDGEPCVFYASGYDERSKYRLSDPELSRIEWSVLHTQGVSIGKVAYISSNIDESAPFGRLQQDWQNTLKEHLKMTRSGSDQSLDASLYAITELINDYSALHTESTQPKSDEPVNLFNTDSSDEDLDFEKLSIKQTSFTPTSHSLDIDHSDPMISAYINVLTTGRSNSSTRTPSPSIPPLPSNLPNPYSFPRNRNESSLLLSAANNKSTTSLLSNLPKVFSSSKSSIKRIDSSQLPLKTGGDLETSTIETGESTSTDDDSKSSQSSKAYQDALATAVHLDACMRRRKLFVTSEGSFGSGPETLQRGDEIVVLFGCSVPVVLRMVGGRGDKEERRNGEGSNEIEKRWELVGEAFVDRFMDAEALAWVVRGQFKVENFVLV
jgi:hypothetical protein